MNKKNNYKVSISPTKRRIQNFKKRKTAYYSMIILLIAGVMSIMAEFIANNKPYVTIYNGSIYFPIFKQYPTSTFNYPSIRPNYRKICNRKGVSCLFPPVKYNPIEITNSDVSFPAPPSWEHPMGLDSLGRDIFARILYGLRISISYALGVWVFAFSIGSIIGCLMGLLGGTFDIVFYRLMEVFFSIPYLIILIILVSIFSPSIILLVAISALFRWGYLTRYMRAEVLKIRKLDYIMSARAAGCNTRQILFRHILPNALTPIITFSPFFIATSILGLSSLDFLGLGVQPPTPSWGELLHQGKEYFLEAWYLAIFPALGLFLTLALINFVGEGVRDAFDPKKY